MTGYVSPTYEPTGLVNYFHKVPRFGHTSDISEIFSSVSNGTGTDINNIQLDVDNMGSYIQGTLFIAGLLFATYILFVIMVMTFKCCCCCCRTSGVRIFAGLPLVEHDEFDEFDELDEMFHDDYDGTRHAEEANIGKPSRRTGAIFRGLILFCTIGVIVSSFIFLFQGTKTIRDTVNHVRNGIDGIEDLSSNIASSADSFITLGETSVNVTESLGELVDEGICNAIPPGVDQNIDGVNAAAKTLLDVLTKLQIFAKVNITDARDGLEDDLNTAFEKIEKDVDDYERGLNLAFYAVPAITLGFVLMIGVMLAWLAFDINIYFLFQTWIILPLLFILISVTVVLIAALSTALVANSDICIGNPSGNPEGFIDLIGTSFLNNSTNQAIDYYILTPCKDKYTKLTDLEELVAKIVGAKGSTTQLQGLFAAQKQQLETVCGGGPGSFDSLESALVQSATTFDEVITIGSDAIDLLSCENINPIWVDIMHDAVCTDAPSALGWMFSSMLVIYIGGMLIFIFRGALLPTKLLIVDNIDDVLKIHNADTHDSDEEEKPAPQAILY